LATLSVVPGIATTAHALTVTGSAAKLAGNFADDTDYSDRAYASSSVGTVTPGGTVPDAIGATLSFTTRYVALLVGDGDALNVDGATGTRTASYRISFSVTAGLGVQYNLAVDTRLLGELTHVNDGSKAGSTTLSLVTGTYAGAGTQGGTLGLTGPTANTSTDGTDVGISKTSLFTVTGLIGTGAPQNYTIDFTWTMSATSDTTGANLGDEAAVRLGQSPPLATLTGTTAGDYPGDNSRVTCLGNVDLSNCDGHTVRVSVTEVPVPPSLSLLGLGLVASGGLYWRRWRRR
jgi:hypothetical protein